MPEDTTAAHLLARLEALTAKQNEFLKEIEALRKDIDASMQTQTVEDEKTEAAKPLPATLPSDVIPQLHNAPPLHRPAPAKSSVEKFIGENLISKAGIVATVIGVAIGTKYAIDHQLLSPLTRIILGYLFGAALLGTAIHLKAKYKNFSAVLMSGSMSIIYFVTYAACDIYQLLPRVPAFAMMVLFTVFTALAATVYNRPVIAHLGLVGAYAIPFLLSDGSGQFVVLMSYMVIINIGILAVSVTKYWKSLYCTSFLFTWFIYTVWYLLSYKTEFFGRAFVFASLFYVTFYITFLVYKLLRQEKYNAGDIVLLLANSFIFFGFGYSMVNGTQHGDQMLGLFTLLNAAVHFAVATIIYRRKIADANLLYLIIGLVLIFITIAIPVQLDANWVTLLWTGEAALLLWIGYTKQHSVYGKLSLPVMLIAFVSIIHDWSSYYGNHANNGTPIVNITFLTSIIFAVAFGLMIYIDTKNSIKRNALRHIITIYTVTVFFIALYYAFYGEIAHSFNHRYYLSETVLPFDDVLADAPAQQSGNSLLMFKTVCLISYTQLFATLVSLANQWRFHRKVLGYFSLTLNIVAIFLFLTKGLYSLSELREIYLLGGAARLNSIITLQFGGMLLAVLLLIFIVRYVLNNRFGMSQLKVPCELFVHFTVLWMASSTLLFAMDMAGASSSYKLALSILWGVYAVMMTVMGIQKKKKQLRYGAMVLFGATLIKLFFYDIAHLNTLSKTVVFVSLGLLMLLISFLYNRYKNIIH